MKKYRSILILSLLALIWNCEEPQQGFRNGFLSFKGFDLLALPDGLHYTLWLVTENEYLYITQLTPDAQGNVSYEDKSIEDLVLQQADMLVVTIEQGSGTTREGPILIAGDWGGMFDSLNMGHSIAFNDNFTTISGLYQLITPTTAATDDSLSGIWFFDTTAIDTFTLNLPDLNEDWTYEGWIEVEGQYLSMGKFRKKNEADDSDIYSGPIPTFNFPGEDFVRNAPEGLTFPLDLRTLRVIISLEPINDPEPQIPFYLQPLKADIFDDALPGEFNDLFRLDFKPPGATATR